MPRLPGISTASPIRGQIQNIENKFTGGLITEASGLNFPESACTSTQNCVFDLQGTVQRREGMNYEVGYQLNFTSVLASEAKTTYLWQNVEGDGNINYVVAQIGNSLYFYNVVSGQPLSPNFLAQIDLSSFVVAGAPAVGTATCQFAAGNGYLFVVHPSFDPIAISHNSGTFTTTQITIQIRDFAGIYEPGVGVVVRPLTLSAEHQYNLTNQGWTSGNEWSIGPLNVPTDLSPGILALPVPTGISGIVNGQIINIGGTVVGKGGLSAAAIGSVLSYTGGILTMSISQVAPNATGQLFNGWVITPVDTGFISEWFSAISNYPSNADVWWYFKDTSDDFDPTVTIGNVTLAAGNAPQGHYVLNAFTQQRGLASGIAGLTDVITLARPSTVAWFQGRAWYAGVNASLAAFGDASYYSWNQNIYFSQIVTDLNDTTDFGLCYQAEDPTSETLFDLLPDDGGVIRIADCGQIFKLFPIQGAMIVFASNGIWTITGNTGLGFTANDYSVNKLSSIRCISGTNFVDILGFPMWWTQEGIYTIRVDVTAGGLRVDSLTDTTIKTFFRAIPLANKQHATGYYNPLNFTVTYLYRTAAVSVFNDNYVYDSALTFHTITGAWSPWVFSNNVAIHGVVVNPLGIQTDVSGTPTDYVNNYLCSVSTGTTVNRLLEETGDRLLQENGGFILLESSSGRNYTFAQTNDNTTWLDWFSFDSVGQDSPAFFEAGYRVHGEAAKKFQANYVFVYSTNTVPTQYTIQGFWNFARSSVTTTTDYPGLVSGTTQAPATSVQTLTHDGSSSDYAYRRIKLRGNGEAVQFKISSVTGKYFHITGWSIYETVNQGV